MVERGHQQPSRRLAGAVRAEITIPPVGDKASPNHPDYRVVSQGTEIGAGWIRTGQTSGKEMWHVAAFRGGAL
ncbi:MAG: DUF736 family protein [Hyphomicrobiaceae bacterium]